MSKFKIVVNIVTLIALLFLFYISRDQIYTAFTESSGLIWWILALQIPTQLLSYGAVAHLYYSYFRNTLNLGKLKLKKMYRISLELNFVNHVFPSGGVSGFSYLSLRLRPFGINFASSTLAQSLRFMLTFLSFLPILGIGLILLMTDSQADEQIEFLGNVMNRGDMFMLVGGSIFLFVVIATALFIYLISSRKRIEKFIAWLPKMINWIVRLVHHKSNKELISIAKVERVLGEIHLGYVQLKENPKALKEPFLHALSTNFFELLTVYLFYLALGAPVNPGAVIFAYSIANTAGLIAVLPGGIGVYEFLMATVMIAAGVDKENAISATLIYRVFQLLIFVPLGFLLYQLAINSKKIEFSVAKTTKVPDLSLSEREDSSRISQARKSHKKGKKVQKPVQKEK